MSRPAVAIQVTERELAYLKRVTDYPCGSFPQLNTKLGDASQAMREAKREANRANKIARNERRIANAEDVE